MKIKIIKFREDVRLPERKHYNDTGADIYMLEGDFIAPGETKVFKLGFGINLPDGYNAHIQARTSLAKQGIYVHQCAIDAGYKGEINMIVTNMSDISYLFDKDDRIGYLEVYPCVYVDYVEDLGEERKDGAFGSTNNKVGK